MLSAIRVLVQTRLFGAILVSQRCVGPGPQTSIDSYFPLGSYSVVETNVFIAVLIAALIAVLIAVTTYSALPQQAYKSMMHLKL